MDELIQQLTGRLGIDAGTANSITGKVMAAVKEQAGPELFKKISGVVPGVENAASAALESSSETAGGLMGAVSGLASKVLGGSAGNTIALGSAMKAAGLNTDQIAGLVETIVGFLKEKVGEDVVNEMLEKVPMLKNLLK